MHKINRPALVSADSVANGDGLRTGNRCLPYGENSVSADTKYGGAFCDSTISLPPQN